MREGGRKKNIESILEKVNEGAQMKKNIRQISGKDNKGDEINKLLTYFKKVNESDEKNKQNKNITGKMFFYPLKCFFYLPKLTVFFGNRQQSNARAGQKNTFFLVMRRLNLMRAKKRWNSC